MQKKTHVLRVEGPEGLGVYRSEAALAVLDKHGGTETKRNQPTWSHDHGLLEKTMRSSEFDIWDRKWNGRYVRFGFADHKQLEAWFPKAEVRKDLQEAGCRVVEYEVPEKNVVRGDAQVIFKPRGAKRVATLDIYPQSSTTATNAVARVIKPSDPLPKFIAEAFAA
jgi:hypothetical protein